MGYPTTDWPTSVDSVITRNDNVDTVWDNEFNYPDEQIRTIQAWIGTTGQLIGAAGAGEGPGGLVSPVADGAGAIAIKLIARDSFVTAGAKLLSVGDDYDTAPPAYTQKFGVDADGVIELTPISPLPAAGIQGRMAYKSGAAEGLYYDDGAAWNAAGGGGGGLELAWVDTYQYTQVGAPVEETINYGYFDGGSVSGTIYFWVMMTPTFGVPGTAQIRLYDVGPAAGPPAAPVLVTTLSTATGGGPQYLEQALAVGGAPGVNTIQSTQRMYEVRIYQSSAPGDVVFIGAGGMADR